MCSKVTSKVEGFILREMIGVHRKKFNFPSYKRRRKDDFIVQISEILEDGGEIKHTLVKDSYPWHTWALPKFDDPGIVRSEQITAVTASDRLVASMGESDLEAILGHAKGHRPVQIMISKYNSETFMRFLAKIAHSYACAILGVNSFTPFLRNYILNGGADGRFFVGGMLSVEPVSPEAYSISLGIIERWDGRKFLSAKIRVLSYLGTPTYVVIIGEGFSGDIFEMSHGFYAKRVKLVVKRFSGDILFTTA